MSEVLLITLLGFLGSFGHCIGMCGPLSVAFSLSSQQILQPWYNPVFFHCCLNGGRLVSYMVTGGIIGALGSVVVAGGQIAGIDSQVRQGFAILTGVLLLWLGLQQINPQFLPPVPFLHPLWQSKLHHHLVKGMERLSFTSHWGVPTALGLLWGFIPCGFLYTAQIKAAETGSLWKGAMVMFAFGLGTLPAMAGIGLSSERMGANQRQQLFQKGGWVTLTIGILTLTRSSEMVDYTGYGAFVFLCLALVARPVHNLCPHLLLYRRTLGLVSFFLSLAHLFHMVEHSLAWNLQAIPFLIPLHQTGMIAGLMALIAMVPMAITSTDRWTMRLGSRWRRLHLLGIPALLLCVAHIILSGSNYLGSLQWNTIHWIRSSILAGIFGFILLLREPRVWALMKLQPSYTQADLGTKQPLLDNEEGFPVAPK